MAGATDKEMRLRAEKSDLEIETILSRIRRGQLDLQPDFQRGEIWNGPRRQRLVDTILRNWFVPAVHIVVEENGDEILLDGQQRLVAIRDFVKDEFVVDGTIPPIDADIADLHGLRYSEMPEARQRAFMRFALSVVTLRDFKPQEPNELFFRLNQSYNLTPSEKRNALHGPARDQVRNLVDDMIEHGLLSQETIGFSNKRLAYDDIIARVCVAIQRNSLRSHINNNTVEAFYRGEAFEDATLDGVRRAGATLLAQIDTGDTRIKFNKGTLQTWLIYAYWAPDTTGELPPGLLHSFEETRLRLRQGGANTGTSARFDEVVLMYDDRASYRVTDVSSVVIRDAAVHLFSEHTFGTRQRKQSSRFLESLRTDSDTSTQADLSEYLDEVRWGEPIRDVSER
ncbi:DUF262 domain-containing protein [Microbacterium sp. 11MF]|uniref:DUF262 domain-containing protein n=1 Tax=Microbacterium sp. 11MF TaxID=1169146 RepID=UPI0004912682|nr:DUF262 domain-containing protein [Microbacterium sp. 11MF]